MSPPLIAAIEAGGTKIVCALGTGPDDLYALTRIPTTTPTETLDAVVAWFRDAEREHGRGARIAGVGVATFGPADVNRTSTTFGSITTTPKPGWANVDVLGVLRRAFPVPAGFDTDVNGAAVAEWRWGAGVGRDSVLYLTVGTGIGGGLCLRGRPLHGLGHPEMGHVFVRRSAEGDSFAGTCPYHGDCLEGVASGPAIAARWGRPADELPDDHPAWAPHTGHLAVALCQFICVLSPQVIVIGGGVGSRAHLFAPLREKVARLINSYVPIPEIVPPGLGDRAGVLGALALGMDALPSRTGSDVG